MLSILTAIFISAPAFAGTPEWSLADTPLASLYPHPREKNLTTKTRFLGSFFSLLPALRENNMNLSKWFREDHIIYLADFLNDEEKLRMIPIFSEIQKRIAAGQKDMKQILIGAGPAVLMAKAAKIDLEVLRLKEQHKDVIRFALTKHESENEQLYGVLPYSYHLRKVREVLKRFGFGPKSSLFALKLGTAAWLHDVIEDTDATYDELKELFGQDIADIVLGMTKIKPEEGESKKDALQRTYERCMQNRGCRILKLADRIANTEEGLLELYSGSKSKVHKYFGEYDVFRILLYKEGDAEEMWGHLHRLLNDQAYALSWAANNLYKKCESTVIP